MKNTKSNSQKLASMRSKYILFVSLAVLLTSAFAIKKFYFSYSDFDKELSAIAKDINKSTPILIDLTTRLDSTEAQRGERFLYHYTLLNVEKGSFNEEELKRQFNSQILRSIKTNPDLQNMREKGASMIYTYRDKNQEYLFELTFEAEDYR